MSKKYQKSMDKIVMSDALKNKIMRAAAEKSEQSLKKPKRMPAWYFRTAAGCAASIAICLLAVQVVKNPALTDNDIVKAPTATHASIEPNRDAEPAAGDLPAVPAEDGTPSAMPKESAKTRRTEMREMPSVPGAEAAAGTETPRGETEPAAVPDVAAEEPPRADSGSATEDTNEQPAQPVQAAPVPDGDGYEMSGGGNAAQGFGIVSMKSVADMRNLVGYDFKVPTDLPDGYVLEEASLVFGIIQLSYESADDTITYRTQRTDEDISGDYNVYASEKCETVGAYTVTMKGDDEDTCHTAVWNDGEAFSLMSNQGIAHDTMVQMIEGVRTPDYAAIPKPRGAESAESDADSDADSDAEVPQPDAAAETDSENGDGF